jgi:hypothetical protein
MKRLLFLLILVTTSIQAQTLELYSGYSTILNPTVFSDSYSPSFTIGGSATLPMLGRVNVQPFADYSHYNGDIDGSDFSYIINAGFNIKADILKTRLRPYLLSGMSISYQFNDNARLNKLGLNIGSEYDNVQWSQRLQAGLGISFDINDTFHIFTQGTYGYTPQTAINLEEGFVVAGIGYSL